MTPAITTAIPASAPVQAVSLQAVLDQLFKPGTVLTAKVMQVLDAELVRIVIADLALDVKTQVPLQPGTTLQLAVSTQPQGGVRLSVMAQTPPGAAAPQSASAGVAAPPLAPELGSPVAVDARTVSLDPKTAALNAAVQSAAPRQASLAPLFANLPVVIASADVPADVRQAATQLLQARPQLGETLTADTLKTAVRNSGIFLEASLAQGVVTPQMTDTKAALLTFRQVLSSWLAVLPKIADGGTAKAATALASQTASGAVFAPEVAVEGQTQATPGSAVVPRAPTTPSSLPSTPSIATPANTSAPTTPASAPSPQALATSLQLIDDLMPGMAKALPPETLETLQTLLAAQPMKNAPSALPEQDLLVQLLGQVLDSEPGGSELSLAAKSLATLTAMAGRQPLASDAVELPDALTTPPPLRNAAPIAQPVVAASITQDMPPEAVGHKLLQQTDAALARQTLLQVASLPDSDPTGAASRPQDMQGPRWSFEIPFATPQGTAMAQFEVSRDGRSGRETAGASRVWRARFTLALEPAGPIHALVTLTTDETSSRCASVRMWAERPETGARLREEAGELGLALRRAELEPGDISVADGVPPKRAAAPAGRFLDRAT